MGSLLPYVFPLLLGRTFDLDKMKVGVDIFAKPEISRTVLIQNPVTETRYKVVESSVEARDLLDVSGSFSLRVKAGLFHAGASGAYLADSYNRENTVDVTIRATYQMMTEQLSSDVQPLSTWRSMGSALGTHFVRSLAYGGELIASVRMVCNNTADTQRIKAALEVGGRIKIFDLGVEVEGDYLKEVNRAVDSTEIKVFSSIPLRKVPNDMQSLEDMLNSFPEDLAKYNGGRGVPIKMELWPLQFFDSTRTAKAKNRVLEAHLDGFEQKFDDLLNTKAAITDWMKVTDGNLSEEEEEQVGKYFSRIQKVLRPFYEVIGRLNSALDVSQLQPALEAYGKNSVAGSYYKEYIALRQNLVADQGEWVLNRGRGATYVHWGRSNCSEMSETLTTGRAYTATGSTDFLCLSEDNSSSTELNRFLFTGYTTQSEGNATDSDHIPCCSCRIGSKGSVHMFSGRSNCPPGWSSLYGGVMANGRLSGGLLFSASFICLERREELEQSPMAFVQNRIEIKDPSREHKRREMMLPCVVCAK